MNKWTKFCVVAALGLALGFGGSALCHKLFDVPVTVKEVNSADAPKAAVKTATVTKKSVLRITPNKERVIYLDAPVAEANSTTIIETLKELDKTKEPVYLLINSPGGSVIDGMQIATQIEGMQAPVYTVCTKMCASMAAYIHQFGVKRYALDRAFLMFHPASGGAMGQLPNMLSRLNNMQYLIDKTNAYVASRSNVTFDELQKKIAYENWVDAESAQQMGLVDSLVVIVGMPNEVKQNQGLFDNRNNNVGGGMQLPLMITPSLGF